MKFATSVFAVLLAPSTGFAEPPAARVSGSDGRVPYVLRGKTLLLDAAETAKAFNWQFKIVRPGKLVAFCRDTGCVPVRLKSIKWETVDKRLFVEAATIGTALSFSVEKKTGGVRLTPLAPARAGSGDLPAYNAKWGSGRGFRVGQTLPDIPLVDLHGEEVRFSKFLGRQYIIYCWASW